MAFNEEQNLDVSSIKMSFHYWCDEKLVFRRILWFFVIIFLTFFVKCAAIVVANNFWIIIGGVDLNRTEQKQDVQKQIFPHLYSMKAQRELNG